jgi:hypothetical protein
MEGVAALLFEEPPEFARAYFLPLGPILFARPNPTQARAHPTKLSPTSQADENRFTIGYRFPARILKFGLAELCVKSE